MTCLRVIYESVSVYKGYLNSSCQHVQVAGSKECTAYKISISIHQIHVEKPDGCNEMSDSRRARLS